MKQKTFFATSQDNVRIAYATVGSGPPLVKVANWLSHLEFDLESPVWSHLIKELAGHHTLIRYDQRGCGLSDRSVVDLSFDAWVHDLEMVVDAAGLDRFPLLGISQGASIAIAYAAKHPQRVTHLILHAGYARGKLKRNPTPQLLEEAELMVRLAEVGWGRENDHAFRQFFTTQFIPGGTAEQHRWFNELQRISTSSTEAARFMRVIHDIDVIDLLPKIGCPTLVLHAAGDVRVPFEEGCFVASRISGARLVSLNSANHLLLKDEPAWKQWYEQVNDFLPKPFAGINSIFSALTPRERCIINLIAQGHDNTQISAQLKLSEKTVRNHVSSIFSKINIKNRGQVMLMAREAGYG